MLNCSKMSREKKGGMMQNLVRRVVKKRSSTTTVPQQQPEQRSPILYGPAPLAQSTVRGTKCFQKQRPRTQMHWGLLGEHVSPPPPTWVDAGQHPVKGLKTRMRFPCQHPGQWDNTGDYGASPPCSPSHVSSLREGPPVQLHFTPPARAPAYDV